MALRLSDVQLVDAAKAHYRSQHWTVPPKLGKTGEQLLNRLSLRPAFVARKDGMEHLVYASGKVTAATFKLLKQVICDLDVEQVFCHVVTVCEEKVSKQNETELRKLGIGILLIRQDAHPNELARPVLRYFRPPSTYDRIQQGCRKKVRQAIQTIRDGDVCVGVLDLSQVLEHELTKKGIKVNTLGAKIKEAQKTNVLTQAAADAAERVNWPRIQRAHPKGHADRRRDIVNRVQEIVDDCMAVLFALA